MDAWFYPLSAIIGVCGVLMLFVSIVLRDRRQAIAGGMAITITLLMLVFKSYLIVAPLLIAYLILDRRGHLPR